MLMVYKKFEALSYQFRDIFCIEWNKIQGILK